MRTKLFLIMLSVSLAACLSSCTALDGLALRQRDKQQAKMFASDPAGYVQASIEKGDYAYWGFRGRKDGERMDWIPGITGQVRDLDRVDFVSIGLEVNDQTGGAAESFFRRYNGILKKERSEAIKRGVKLDAYGRCRKSLPVIGH